VKKRIHPAKDDKILADWNGLMIAALAKGAGHLTGLSLLMLPAKQQILILNYMRGQDHRLYHRYREGECSVRAFLDDHAFFAWGLIELYEATF